MRYSMLFASTVVALASTAGFIGSAAAAAGTIAASIVITNTWTGGYCAVVDVSNSGSSPITDWTVVINLNGAQTYQDPNNAAFQVSGSSLTLNSISYNSKLAPGEAITPTSSRAGYCVNGNQTPVIISATATAAVCTTVYLDMDNDGFGDPSTGKESCDSPIPTNYVNDNTDCCDKDARSYPGQPTYFSGANTCGGFDYNCDSSSTPATDGITGCFETPTVCTLNAAQTVCDIVPTGGATLPAGCNGSYTSHNIQGCGKPWSVQAKGCDVVCVSGSCSCKAWTNTWSRGVLSCK